MTMHIEGPWLSTTGKKRGKIKFRNSAEARKARELDESWKALQKKWGVEQEERRRKRAMDAPVWQPEKVYHRGAEDPRPKSLNTWVTGAVSSKAAPQYTGTKMLGIGTMHKSNAVPIFSDTEAQEISTMRR